MSDYRAPHEHLSRSMSSTRLTRPSCAARTSHCFWMLSRNVRPGDRQPAFRGPSFEPFDSGLGKLLATYGIKITPSMVLDENCYKQRLPSNMGGGERPIYFAPLIKSTNINQELPFMENIRGLIALKMSPLVIDEERLAQNGLTGIRLFSSSDKSWEMEGRISLDPRLIPSPPPAEDLQAYPLAYVLEGEFPSHFAGQPIPEKPAPPEAEGDADTETPAARDLSGIESTSNRRDKSVPAKILCGGIVGTHSGQRSGSRRPHAQLHVHHEHDRLPQ